MLKAAWQKTLTAICEVSSSCWNGEETVMLEWQRDWAETDTYDAVRDIVKTHCGACNVGVEYAYPMIHGAPATELAVYVVPPCFQRHTSSNTDSVGVPIY